MRNPIIKGHFRQEGGALTPGSFDIDEFQDLAIIGREYLATEGMVGIELATFPAGFAHLDDARIRAMGSGRYTFLPDPGECQRLGIRVVPLEN